MVRLTYALVTVFLGSCTLYFGGDDLPPEVCDGSDAGPPIELRNPETLECVPIGAGCDSACGPCPGNALAPAPPWGQCGDRCEALGEFECAQNDRCRVAYDYDCYFHSRECTALTPFIGCFALSLAGTSTGTCIGLGSWACSSRADCVALHQPVCDPTTGVCWRQFVDCQPELLR